jgi:hypothetical protein
MADVMDIEKMPREDFLNKIVRGFAKWEIFSRLLCLGPDSLQEFEKSHLRDEMVHAGIPKEAIETEMGLYGMARQISQRAVNVR